MLASLVAVLVAAAAAPVLVRRLPRGGAWLLAALFAGVCAWYGTHVPAVAAGAEIRERVPWMPPLQAALTFRLDGLSLLFAILITGLGALICAYAGAYLDRHPHRGRFFAFLLLFAAAMLGLVLADNVFALFVFWELTSFSSYLLIGFDHERPTARSRALQALLVTGTGGLALLAGLVLLGLAAGAPAVAGTFELSEIASRATDVREHRWYLPILGLVTVGAFTKSAQVPFHFWLPNAMEAPTPVSAYLHSATMVKAGIYLLARLQPTLGGTDAWFFLLTGIGGVTAVVGAVLALRQTDLKLILAYSTVSALGTLTLTLGWDHPGAATAAMAFLLAHALYKGALFLSAGAVDHAAGSRDITALAGLRRAMPWTASATGLAALSMVGTPLFIGFPAKELLYKSALAAPLPALWVVPLLAASALTVVAAGLVALRPFARPFPPSSSPALNPAGHAPHEVSPAMWFGILLLATASLVLGSLPGPVATPLVAPAASAVASREDPVLLAPWYGLDAALLLSAGTILAGGTGYALWHRVHSQLARLDRWLRLGPERWYESGLSALQRLAVTQTRLIQHGQLRLYLLSVFAVLLALAALALIRGGGLPTLTIRPAAGPHHYALAAVIAAAAVTAAVARSRLTAVASIGVVGVSLSVLFVTLGAPDLAMTQFLADMLVVVITILVMRLLPRLRPNEYSSPWVRARDWTLAIGVGGLVTLLLLLGGTGTLDRTIPEFYARASVPEAFGRNIVNVILVDFRALDTLGEILVLALAALGVHALIRFRRMPPREPLPQASSILQTTTRFLFTLLVLFSLFLLFRGHNSPGGGFIGGLVAAGAFALYLLAFGAEALRTLLRVPPRVLLAGGLVLALASGMAALLVALPLLTSLWVQVTALGTEPLKIGTPLGFDIGVYFVVLGFTLTLILDFEEA